MNISRYATAALLALLLAVVAFAADTAQAGRRIVPIIAVSLNEEISDGHWNSVTVRDDRLNVARNKVLTDRVHVVSDSDPMGEWVTVEGYRWLSGSFPTSHTDEPGVLQVQPCDYVSVMYYDSDGHRMMAGDKSMAGVPHNCPKDPMLGRIEMLEAKVHLLCEYVQMMMGEHYHVCQ